MSYAIIEADFPRRFRLLVDMQNKCLVDEVTSLTVHGIACAGIPTESLHRFPLNRNTNTFSTNFLQLLVGTLLDRDTQEGVLSHISSHNIGNRNNAVFTVIWRTDQYFVYIRCNGYSGERILRTIPLNIVLDLTR